MHTAILTGGVGSRLWPFSRELDPKPFMKMPDGKSFLQKTYLRNLLIKNLKSHTTVTNKELFYRTKQDLNSISETVNPEINKHYLIEPFGRNTAAAIALTSLYIAELYGKQSVILAVPADHVIANEVAFLDALKTAEKLALQGKIVTFGIKPDFPETGYGYIEADENDVRRFIEKPSFEKAQEYVSSPNYLWNSGIFCFTCETMLEELSILCPEILNTTKESLKLTETFKDVDGSNCTFIPADKFKNVPENSIDYAVMEKTTKAAVVSCDMGWSDIGTWASLSQLVEPDEKGNRKKGNVIAHQTANCYIESTDRLVATVGVKDLIIVDSPDALLVTQNESCQDVKNVFSELKNLGCTTHKLHKTVQRPWGSYTILNEGPNFKIKRIEVLPGGSLSLQLHHHRAEHWVVVSGMANVVNGDKELVLHANDSTFIPAGHKHRLTNHGQEVLVMIEVQTGNYFGEDDIVRFDDIYGRVPHAA